LSRSLLLLLALSAPASASPLDDLFEFSSRAYGAKGNLLAAKQSEFERLLGTKGPAAIVRALRKAEPGLAELQKQRKKEYARFSKAHAAYFGWRQKKSDNAEDVPRGINRAFLDTERQIRAVNTIVYRHLTFVEWSLARLQERYPAPTGKYLAALTKGIRDRNPYQRLRCIRLLAPSDDPAALEALAAAFASERHPAVAAALAATGKGDCSPAMLQDAWTVRAGGIAGLRIHRDRAVAALLVPRLARERGRLLDDIHGALSWIAGGERADWAEWLAGLPARWTPVAYPEKDPPGEDVAIATPSASGRVCFGLPTGSTRVILCVDAALGAAARGEIARFLGTLPASAEFGIVAFGAGARAFKKKLVAASGANRAAAAKWMERVDLAGRADIYDGLQLAFDLADAGKNRPARADTIVLAAPQRPTRTGMSPTLVDNPRQIALEIGRRNALLRVRIHAIGLSTAAQSYYLQQLARAYGGGFKPTGR